MMDHIFFIVLSLDTPLQGNRIGSSTLVYVVKYCQTCMVNLYSFVYLDLSEIITLGWFSKVRAHSQNRSWESVHHLFIASVDVLSTNLQYSLFCLLVVPYTKMCIAMVPFWLGGRLGFMQTLTCSEYPYENMTSHFMHFANPKHQM
jgi:hypothetical protein